MPDLIITDDLVHRCAEAALNAGRAYLGEQWLVEARAVLVEALK